MFSGLGARAGAGGSRRRRAWTATAGVAVTAVALVATAACSPPGDAATPTISPVSPTAVNPSPTSAAPSGPTGPGSPTSRSSAVTAIPPAARADTAAGAEAFARYYFDRLNAAFMDPGGVSIRELADASCTTCTNLDSSVHQFARDGQRTLSRPYQLGPSSELPESTPRARAFGMLLTHPRTTIVDRAGRAIRSEPRQVRGIEILVRRSGASWIVADVALARGEN